MTSQLAEGVSLGPVESVSELSCQWKLHFLRVQEARNQSTDRVKNAVVVRFWGHIGKA